MRRRLLAAAVLLVALAACSRHVTLGGEAKQYRTAEENYDAGMELMKDGAYPEATKFFEQVKTRFPLDKHAALAELRLADVKFEEGKHAEAADAYAQFVQLHPAHEQIEYAEFRVGLSYLKDAPSEFALFPPAYEKDLRQVRKAADTLKRFLDKYPTSKYAPEAKNALGTAQTRLSSYEWYVAEFYFKRERWAGAAGRYETLVEKYPGSKHEVEALMKLAHAAVEMKEPYRARTALQKLIVDHPNDPRRPEAEKMLAALR
jgi:outer membrane protein assembly factor BamD